MTYDLCKGTWFKKMEELEMGSGVTFALRFIREGAKYGIKFGTDEFIVYQYIREGETSGWHEWLEKGGEEGELKRNVKERFGFDSEEAVGKVLSRLFRKGAVIVLEGLDRCWISEISIGFMDTVLKMDEEEE